MCGPCADRVRQDCCDICGLHDDCVGAVLFGGACYTKTKVLPIVPQVRQRVDTMHRSVPRTKDRSIVIVLCVELLLYRARTHTQSVVLRVWLIGLGRCVDPVDTTTGRAARCVPLPALGTAAALTTTLTTGTGTARTARPQRPRNGAAAVHQWRIRPYATFVLQHLAS